MAETVRPPDYVTLDEKGREEFLSDLGTFSPGERAFFHRLCRMWEPEISYNRANQTGPDSGAMVGQDLDRLLEKLRIRGYAAVVGTSQNGEFRKQAIALTGRWDERYYRYRVADEVQRLIDSGTHVLPLVETIGNNGLEVPDTAIIEIDFPTLARIHSGGSAPADRVLRLSTPDGKAYLLVASLARRFIESIVEKVRYHCTNGALLEVLAKIRDTSLGQIRSMLGSGNPGSWLEITGVLIDERKQIESKRTVVVEPSLFDAALVLREFIRSEIEEARQRRKRREERIADFQAIAEAVKRNNPPLVPVETFSRLVLQLRSKYGEDFEQFSREFYEAVLKPKEKRNLPVVLLVKSSYVHRDLVFPLFRTHLDEAAKALGEEYVQRMSFQIRHGRKNIDSAFLSKDAFEADMMGRIRELDEFLGEILQKPPLFAEALIHHHKQTNKKPAIGDVRMLLAQYLDIEPGTFLPLSHLCDLNMVSIFESAFLRLPLWRQFIIRVSGRYETVKDKYIGRTTQPATTKLRYSTRDSDTESRPVDLPSLRRDQSDRAGQARRPTGRAEYYGARTRSHAGDSTSRSAIRRRGAAGSAATGGGLRDLNAQKAAKSRQYTQQQRDSAWDEFSKILKDE